MAEKLSSHLMQRLQERAADPQRRTDAATLSGQTVSLGSLLGELGSSNPQLQQLSGLMGQFAGVMKGFGVMAPMPVGDRATGRDPEPLPPRATAEEIAECEKAIGRNLPEALRRLYAEVADGGFGPGGGLFPLERLAAEYHEMTREPAGPQNQPWPANLLPLVDAEPGYDCLDLESGEMVAWDPEELDSYSNAAWKRSFKPLAPSLAGWLEEWLNRPTAGERMAAEREREMNGARDAHLRNMMEYYEKNPEKRTEHGLPEVGWEDEVRRRHSPPGL